MRLAIVLLCSLILMACNSGEQASDTLPEAGIFYVGGSADTEHGHFVNQAQIHYFKSTTEPHHPIVMLPGLGLTANAQ